jgi:hypothetical protein
MNQLSSCYFCGDALDASLEDHPVVPPSLRSTASPQQTVVLCGSCKRKFDAVMDTVVAAVDEGEPADSTRGAGAGRESADPSHTAGSGSAPDSDIETTLGEDDDVLRPVGEEGSSEADRKAGAPTGKDEASDANERTYTSSRRAGYTGSDRSMDSGRDRSTDSDSGGSSHRRRDENSDGRSSDKREQADAEGSTGQNRRDSDDETEADDGPDVTLTRLENTKVMRLLKNREFPVVREDFVTVASSAYEVSPRDCDKVVELAIEHDLLREENGQLYAGPQWQ